MIVHLIDGTYELFRHFYGIRRWNKGGDDPPFGAVAGVLHTVAADDGRRRHAPGCRDRSRHRVLPQRPLARLQDRRRHRSGALGAVPSARGRARRPWAWRYGRWWSSRPTTRSHPPRISPPRTSAWRRCASGRPTRISRNASSAIAWSRSIGRATRSATPTACAPSSASRRRCIPDYLALVGDAADGYPGTRRHGAQDRGPALGSMAARAVPARGPGDNASAGAAVQEPRHAAHRCAALRRRGSAALARRDRRLSHAVAEKIGDARLAPRVLRSRAGSACKRRPEASQRPRMERAVGESLSVSGGRFKRLASPFAVTFHRSERPSSAR